MSSGTAGSLNNSAVFNTCVHGLQKRFCKSMSCQSFKRSSTNSGGVSNNKEPQRSVLIFFCLFVWRESAVYSYVPMKYQSDLILSPQIKTPRGLQKQSESRTPTEEPPAPHCGVQQGPARFAVHSTEIGEGIRSWEKYGVQRNTRFGILFNDWYVISLWILYW